MRFNDFYYSLEKRKKKDPVKYSARTEHSSTGEKKKAAVKLDLIEGKNAHAQQQKWKYAWFNACEILMDAICSFHHEHWNDEGTLAVQNNLWNNSYCMHWQYNFELVAVHLILFYCVVFFNGYI